MLDETIQRLTPQATSPGMMIWSLGNCPGGGLANDGSGLLLNRGRGGQVSLTQP